MTVSFAMIYLVSYDVVTKWQNRTKVVQKLIPVERHIWSYTRKIHYYIYTVCLFDTFFHMPTLYIFFITFIESGLFSLQLNWLNKYYETIRRLVGPELDEQDLDEEKDWMLKHTESFIQSGTSASVCSSSLTLIALAVALLHNIIWAASSLLHSLHSQQTRALMLPLCSLYWAAIPGWEIHCNLAFSFDWRIYLFDNLIGWVNGW